MKLLAIESYGFKPILETTGEILIENIKTKESCFCYVGNDIPLPKNVKDHYFKQALFINMKNRIVKFESLLKKMGILIIKSPIIDEETIKKINKWAEDFNGDEQELRKYSYKGYRLGLGVTSSLISKYRISPLNTNILKTEIKKNLVAAAIVYEKSLSLLKSQQPEILLTYNGRFSYSYPIVKAAEEVGTKVLFHEAGSDYNRYEIYDCTIHSNKLQYERIVKHWNEAKDQDYATKQGESFYQLQRYGSKSNRNSYIRAQTKGKNLKLNKKFRFVYFTSSEDEFMAVEDGGEFDFKFGSQRNALLALINILKKMSNHELIIRIHPNFNLSDKEELKWWFSLERENLKVISPLSDIDSYALAESADVVVTYGSTMGIEAAYWGIPSILLGSAPYAELGSCFTPNTEAELEVLLKNIPKTWDIKGCIKYGYYVMTFGREYKHYKPFGPFDGRFFGQELNYLNPLGIFVKKFVYFLRGSGIGIYLRTKYQKTL